MILNAVKCSKCKDIIFNRTSHDSHYCKCRLTYISGSPDLYIQWSTSQSPLEIRLELDITQQQLFDDWNLRTDKYGSLSKINFLTTKKSDYSAQRKSAIEAPELLK